MKKNYSFFLLIFLFAFNTIKAQGIIQFNIISPVSNNPAIRTTYGGGCGFEVLSAPLNIIKPGRKSYSYLKTPSPLCIRFGAEMDVAWMGYRNFKNIPLLAPETGEAKVHFSNHYYNVNINVRLSTSMFNGQVIPYVEGFLGCRDFSTDMKIIPNKNGRTTDTTLAGIDGLNVGVSGGLLFKLDDDAYLSIGATWNHSEVPGKFVDLRSLDRIGNSIEYYTRPSPVDFLVFKIGLTIYINDSGYRSSGSYHSTWGGGGCFHSGGGGGSHIGLIGH